MADSPTIEHLVAQNEHLLAALKDCEFKFRMITEQIREVFYISALADGRMHYISPAYEEIWGRTCQSLYENPQSFIDAVHPEDRSYVLAQLQAQHRNQRTEMEYRIVRPDGSVRWIHDSTFPYADSDGRVLHMSGLATDITEKRRLHLELHESREYFKGLFDNVDIPKFVVEVHENGRYSISNLNRYYAQRFGVTTEHYRGRTLDALDPAFLPRETVASVTARYDACVRSGQHMQYEEDLMIAGQKCQFLTMLTPVTNEEGRVFRLIGAAVEITELKRAQRELKELNATLEARVASRTHDLEVRSHELASLLETHQATLRTLRQRITTLDQINDAVVVIDGEYRITYWNAAAESMYGVPTQEALGKQLFDIYTYDWFDPADEAAAFESLHATGHWRGENFHIRHDGVRIAVESSVSTEQDEEGRITSMIAVIRSIDARRRTEEELRAGRDALHRKNEELAQASRLKDEFLANMSHELRTPLTTVQILTEAMRDQLYGTLNERQLRAVRTIEESGQHLLSLINDILDLAKIEAGQLQLLLEPCSLAELCREAMAFVGQQAERKNMRLYADLPDDHVIVQVDARRVKQILINLLSNAVKFTPPEGSVRLRARIDDVGRCVCLSVEDTGIGISAEDIPRLFVPFTQIDSGLSRSYPGTGLGLSLVHRMTDLHGGSVEVASTPGTGSTFTVRLPLGSTSVQMPSQTASASDERDPSIHPASTGGIRILLVDDSESSLLSLSEYLRLKGFDVTTASSGREAVACVERETFDLVLMDIQMPEMTGLEATQRIRRLDDPQKCTVPIVALTALAMSGDRERCMQAGVDAYLSKPVMFDTLLAMIASVTGRSDSPA